MNYRYQTRGTCSREISFDLTEDNIVQNVRFVGGCNGNLKGIAKLAEGRPAAEVVALLEGITCMTKPTSCPDQLAQALKQALQA